MKSYTDIEQSRKLSKILSIESADMHYSLDIDIMEHENIPTITEENNHFELFPSDIPCWSLAALIGVLPYMCNVYRTKSGVSMIYYSKEEIIVLTDNYIDACVEMILKLNKLDLI